MIKVKNDEKIELTKSVVKGSAPAKALGNLKVDASEENIRPHKFVDLLKVRFSQKTPKFYIASKHLKNDSVTNFTSDEFSLLTDRKQPINSLALGQLVDLLVEYFATDHDPEIRRGLQVISLHATMVRHLQYLSSET